MTQLAAKTTIQKKSKLPDSESGQDVDSDFRAHSEAKGTMRFSKINFDKLVEMVKEKLQKDLLDKQKENEHYAGRIKTQNRNRNKGATTDSRPTTSYQSSEDYRVTRFKRPLKAPNKHDTKKQKDNDEYIEEEREDYIKYGVKYNSDQYQDYKVISVKSPDRDESGVNQHKNNQYKQQKNNDRTADITFDSVKMTLRNDSYEDYVTPAKAENIFESASKENDEKKSERVEYTTSETVAGKPKRDTDERTNEYEVNIEEDFKAQTGNLWYDDQPTNVTEDYTENTNRLETSTRKKGTIIPKRDFYKMSSPNYLAKVPNVAEKYDFEEPIPEEDREPENLKPLPVLPSVINGKVKYSK